MRQAGIQGEPGESFRDVLYRAFREAAISEDEFAARLGERGLPMTQAAVHGLLKRDGSINEKHLRQASCVLTSAAAPNGYAVRIELVPIGPGVPAPERLVTSKPMPLSRAEQRAAAKAAKVAKSPAEDPPARRGPGRPRKSTTT